MGTRKRTVLSRITHRRVTVAICTHAVCARSNTVHFKCVHMYRAILRIQSVSSPVQFYRATISTVHVLCAKSTAVPKAQLLYIDIRYPRLAIPTECVLFMNHRAMCDVQSPCREAQYVSITATSV